MSLYFFASSKVSCYRQLFSKGRGFIGYRFAVERKKRKLGKSYVESKLMITRVVETTETAINPLRPNNDLSQTYHCNIKGLSVRDVMRIENMFTQVKFY